MARAPDGMSVRTARRAVDSPSTPVRARTYLRRRTWRGARRDRGAPNACQYFTRTSAAHPRSSPRVGPAAPGMTSLTRCTAARGTCKWVLRGRADGCHLTDTSACAAGGRASFYLVRPNLRLYPAQTAAGQAAVFSRTDARSELACDGFRCGGCCTLLLYRGLERCDQIFELRSLSWRGAMGIRPPDLLHAMQVRQPAYQRHHRLLPADLVHPRACECLPVAGRWLSNWLSTISLDHELFECPKARGTAHAGNAERSSRTPPPP